MIKIGDLLYDADDKCFGVVSERREGYPFPWIVTWNDGRINWVDSSTVNVWKKELKDLISGSQSE